MMKEKLYESELKVMEILWSEGDMAARDLASKLKASTAWDKTTSYTIIRKCTEKGLVERLGANYLCRALITREEAQEQEVGLLADKMFDGSSDLLIASLLGRRKMTPEQVDKLRNLVEEFM